LWWLFRSAPASRQSQSPAQLIPTLQTRFKLSGRFVVSISYHPLWTGRWGSLASSRLNGRERNKRFSGWNHFNACRDKTLQRLPTLRECYNTGLCVNVTIQEKTAERAAASILSRRKASPWRGCVRPQARYLPGGERRRSEAKAHRAARLRQAGGRHKGRHLRRRQGADRQQPPHTASPGRHPVRPAPCSPSRRLRPHTQFVRSEVPVYVQVPPAGLGQRR